MTWRVVVTQTTLNFITATASVERISPPRTWPHPPPTMRSCFTGREGVIAREIVASRAKAPPPPLRFVLRLQKGGVFVGHYSNRRRRYASNIVRCGLWHIIGLSGGFRGGKASAPFDG